MLVVDENLSLYLVSVVVGTCTVVRVLILVSICVQNSKNLFFLYNNHHHKDNNVNNDHDYFFLFYSLVNWILYVPTSCVSS